METQLSVENDESRSESTCSTTQSRKYYRATHHRYIIIFNLSMLNY